MTTLLGDELFDYLAHLESEVNKRISESSKGSLVYLMHSQMRDIITAERNFLQYINSNGTEAMLSISPNGLPSVESLNPDLEKMCELEDFEDIKQRYQKSIDPNEKKLYISVSEEEWNNELKNRKKETLPSKIDFAINETIDGKFELTLRENVYRKGYDRYSKEHPILVREGKMQYHIIWGRLIENSEESFYVPNTALALKGKSEVSAKPNEKIINGLVIKKMGKDIYRGITNFTGNLAKGILFSPTGFWQCNKWDPDPSVPRSCFAGRVIGVISIMPWVFIGYPILIGFGGPIGAGIVGTHLATNLGSGIYEWFRYEKNKLEEKEKKEYEK